MLGEVAIHFLCDADMFLIMRGSHLYQSEIEARD